MVKVEFLGPISHDAIELEVDSIKELGEVLRSYKELENWIKISAVAVNGKIIHEKGYSLSSGDVVSILPPVCGG